jgi:hypothetical protein
MPEPLLAQLCSCPVLQPSFIGYTSRLGELSSPHLVDDDLLRSPCR